MGRVGAWRGVRTIVCACVLVLVHLQVLVWNPLPARAMEESASVRVPVLVYHNVDYSGSEFSVTPEQLDEQCRWLIDNGYTSITVWQFWDAAMGLGTLPVNPVLLTNDDGWSSAMTFAEILGRYGLVGNYFLNNVSPLSADQILTLSQYGPVQAHTATHQVLSQMDFEGQLAEISQNVAYLEQITGQPVRFLAWPFGDYNASAVEAAAASGIVGAFGLNGTGCYMHAVDPYHVPRIMMGVGDDLDTFAAKVGWW
jgi:peptidoglycan/xylan/chitin deacetylase (PgdA/CDA1 family)